MSGYDQLALNERFPDLFEGLGYKEAKDLAYDIWELADCPRDLSAITREHAQAAATSRNARTVAAMMREGGFKTLGDWAESRRGTL